jgi:hypothetical protein
MLLLRKRIVPVFGSDCEDVLAQLETAGFDRLHLPRTVGGSWDYKEYEKLLASNGLVTENTDSVYGQGLTSEMIATGLAELEEAIAALPEGDKNALLKDRVTVPGLAEREAPPFCFLRFENYKAQAAASRLAAYWRMRSSIFR